MSITVDYITARHAYWLKRINEAGIWKPRGLDKVNLRVRPQARTLNGKFMRKIIRSRNPLLRPTIVDTIIIYDNPWLDSEIKIDSVIVHEMIHHYITVSRQRDTSSHGQLFRSLMDSINRRFAGELDLHISTRSESYASHTDERKSGAPYILAIVANSGQFYCCRVMKSAVASLHSLLTRLKQRGQITHFEWYLSDDRRFDRLSACRSRLHGLRFPISELEGFIASHGLTPIPLKKH